MTNRVMEDYCAAISIGAPHDTASSYANVTYAAALMWRTRGEEEQKRIESGEKPDEEMAKYHKFFMAVEAARYERRIKWLQVIDQAASREADWAWRMLQNDDPENFRPPSQRAELTGKNGGAVKVQSGLSPEFAAALNKIYGDKGDGNG